MESLPSTRWLAIAAFLMALAVAMGAFGAHALKDRLDPYSLSVYEKGAFYHFIHALALLIIPLMSTAGFLTAETQQKLCAIFLGGIVIFSGTLYALAITGIKWLGAITPIGGTLFIVGWCWLGISLLRAK